MLTDATFIPSVILLLVSLVLFVIGFVFFRKKRLIENTPTSKIRSLAMGLAEIYGKVLAAADGLLTGPLTKKAVVYYHYLVERHEQHYNPSTKRTESRWVTVQNEKQSVHFYLQDDTGKVLVDPAHASLEIQKVYQTRSGNMRYTERYIEPNDTLYILGTAGENPLKTQGSVDHVDNIMIQKGMNEKQYYISDKSEKQLLKNLTLKTYGLWGVGVVLLIFSFMLLMNIIKL